MSAQRFHLVCLGFKDSVANKTQLSLTLKDQLKLNDAQLADLMANRRTVLARNLPEEKARQWAKKLTRAGLNIEAETATANQKISADELRQHLLDGGLSHYFAGQYRHPDDEMETRISLLVLAAIPFAIYLLLPLIALLLVLPLISLSVWGSQPGAALTQLVIAGALLVPAALFRPRPPESQGLELDPDTEPLLFALTNEITTYLKSAPVTAIRITDAPFVSVRQKPLQWLRRRCELEIGLPYVQAVTLQQLTGELTRQLGSLAPPFTYWTWGAFSHWQRTLAHLQPAWSEALMQRIAPMVEHLQARQTAMMQTLIGHQQARQVTRLTQRLNSLKPLWPEFRAFCSTLGVSSERWVDWLGPIESKPVADEENSQGQFRMASPASWVLSNASGYEKALHRDAGVQVTAATLLKQFQTFQKHHLRVRNTGIQVDALVPPVSAISGKTIHPAQLMRHYSATRATQKAAIAHALGLQKNPPKQDLAALTQRWRSSAQGLWPKAAMTHPNLALGRALFSVLQSAQQLDLWADCEPADSEAKALRKRQLDRLYPNWHKAMLKLPALPLGAARGQQSLAQQLALPTPAESVPLTSADTGRWVNTLQIYWTLVAGSLLNSGIETDTEQAAA
jgi:hypothetical protein